MKDIIDKLLERPFVTVMVVGAISGGIAKIIKAAKVLKK